VGASVFIVGVLGGVATLHGVLFTYQGGCLCFIV